MELKFTGANVPIEVVANAMNKDPAFIRVALQRKILPIGAAMKMEDDSRRYAYYISPKLLYEYTGFVYEPALKKAPTPTKVESAQKVDM